MDDRWRNVQDIAAFISNLLEGSAALLALFLFWFKRKELGQALRLLMNHALQLSLTELISKLDRLNELDGSRDSDRGEILNILGDISGHIRGSQHLKMSCSASLRKISRILNKKEALEEPTKRSIVSELRSTIRYVGLSAHSTQSEESSNE